MLTWSDETRRSHGVPTDSQPEVATAIGFYAPEARPMVQAAIERGIRAGAGWDLELPLDCLDGQRVWVQALGAAKFEHGVPVRLTGAFRDITQRVAERTIIARLNQRFALATDSAGIGVWDSDIGSGIVALDPWMRRLWGFAVEVESAPFDRDDRAGRLRPRDA